ncbi:hypothetical protein RZN05_11905 [Sphingomonas sp. HF-S4]|uniref:DUF6998 domain-containing protein n=1 Tax=Sphingomonas agrestis TaxID=3080540 RepID=A0ABU3Y9A5_9SPHN|nr:hypothetical protein [Sphingomonas sp. HF-S4]MDV3457692.1 hypothetical protein [Sphingomonas sp. HF-S4]
MKHAAPASTARTGQFDGAIRLPEAVRALVTAHRALVLSYVATALRFTLDGRLVGDIGEATAASAFGLELCRTRTPGIDALTDDGRTVQIKASGIGKGPAFSPGEGRADHLIFLMLDFERAEARVRYNGPEAPVRAELPPEFTSTKRVSVPRILTLDAAVDKSDRLKRIC